MAFCRVVCTRFDSELRLEALLDFISKNVVPFEQYKGLVFTLNTALDEDCFKLTTGVYNYYKFSGTIDMAWDRPHDHTFLKEFNRVKSAAQELANSTGVRLVLSEPTIETEDVHLHRVEEALKHYEIGINLLVVPVETMKVVCQLLEQPPDSLIVIQRSKPEKNSHNSVSDFKDFCRLKNQVAFNDDSAVLQALSQVLEQIWSRERISTLEKSLQLGSIRIKKVAQAPVSVVRSDIATVMSLLKEKLASELLFYKERETYHHSIISNIETLWRDVEDQLSALQEGLVPIQASDELAEVKRELDDIRLTIRTMPTKDEFSVLEGEVQGLKAERTAIQAETAKVRESSQNLFTTLAAQNQVLTKRVEEMTSTLEALAAAPRSVEAGINLTYRKGLVLKHELEIVSQRATPVSGLSFFIQIAQGFTHTCIQNLTIYPGQQTLTTHRHFPDESFTCYLSLGSRIVSNVLKVSTEEANCAEMTNLNPDQSFLLEKVLENFGYDNVKAELVTRFVDIVRKPRSHKLTIEEVMDELDVA